MFEWEWPWLTDEEADEKVADGIHTIILNKIRKVAANMGYEESYYARAGGNTAGEVLETWAFYKHKGAIQKFLYYQRTAAASVAIFQHSSSGMEKHYPRNFWEDC